MGKQKLPLELDLDAARRWHSDLGKTLEDFAYRAPELWPATLKRAVHEMNQIAKALRVVGSVSGPGDSGAELQKLLADVASQEEQLAGAREALRLIRGRPGRATGRPAGRAGPDAGPGGPGSPGGDRGARGGRRARRGRGPGGHVRMSPQDERDLEALCEKYRGPARDVRAVRTTLGGAHVWWVLDAIDDLIVEGRTARASEMMHIARKLDAAMDESEKRAPTVPADLRAECESALREIDGALAGFDLTLADDAAAIARKIDEARADVLERFARRVRVAAIMEAAEEIREYSVGGHELLVAMAEMEPDAADPFSTPAKLATWMEHTLALARAGARVPVVFDLPKRLRPKWDAIVAEHCTVRDPKALVAPTCDGTFCGVPIRFSGKDGAPVLITGR